MLLPRAYIRLQTAFGLTPSKVIYQCLVLYVDLFQEEESQSSIQYASKPNKPTGYKNHRLQRLPKGYGDCLNCFQWEKIDVNINLYGGASHLSTDWLFFLLHLFIYHMGKEAYVFIYSTSIDVRGSLGKESHSSVRMWPLVRFPCSNE